MAPTLTQQIERYGEIFVRNMTTNPPAIVVVHFRVPGRRPYILKVPPGPHPVKIYPGRVPEVGFREGADEMIGFLETGVLRCIPPKKAKAVLRNPEVRNEQKALLSRVNSDQKQRRFAREVKRAADQMPGQQIIDPIPGMHDMEGYVSGPGQGPRPSMLPQNPLAQIQAQYAQGQNLGPSRAQHQLNIAGAPDGVNHKVLGLMASYMPEMDNQVLRQLKGIASSLTINDFALIQQRAGVGSGCGMWATKQLQRLHGGQQNLGGPMIPGVTG
jgi:hypothetical protein